MVNRNNKFCTIIIGYKNILMSFLKGGALLVLILGVNAIIFYPLWYCAVNFKVIYSRLVGLLLISGILILVVRTISKKVNIEKQYGRSPFLFLKKPLIKITGSIFFLGYIYLFLILLHLKHYYVGAGTLIVFFFLAGWLLFIKKPKNAS